MEAYGNSWLHSLSHVGCGSTHLVVWGQLHSGHAVDVLLDLVEEVIPASDQATLVLVVDQVQLVRVPHLTDLDTEIPSNVKISLLHVISEMQLAEHLALKFKK